MRLDHLLSRENIGGVYLLGCGAWCGCWVSHTISCGTLSPCLLVIIVVVVAGGGVVLCENCIVDAKSFFCLISFVLFCVCFSCGAPLDRWCVCCKGARWMPGHVKPMKDVKGCVKPRGVAD